MNETVNQANETTPTAGQPEKKTFTQEELDAIIGDRLSREKAKYADYESLKEKAAKFDAAEEANKTELQKAQDKVKELQQYVDAMTAAENVRKIREKVAAETNVPADLLSGDTEESCKTQAQAILKFAKPAGYPNVKDGGEVNHNSGGKTRDQFKDWFDAALSR